MILSWASPFKFNNQTVQYGRLTENRQYAFDSPETIIVKLEYI